MVVDSPDFHLGLVSRLRRVGYGGKTVCLATPTVWAWRSGRVRALRAPSHLAIGSDGRLDLLLATVTDGVDDEWWMRNGVGGKNGHGSLLFREAEITHDYTRRAGRLPWTSRAPAPQRLYAVSSTISGSVWKLTQFT